jgi:hypothetical protein
MPSEMGSLITQEVLDNIEEMRESKIWMDKRLSELKTKYPNEFIAIYKKKLVGHNPDFKILIRDLKKNYKNIDNFIIEFITGEDYIFIL